MIKKWYITGDTHGNIIPRIKYISSTFSIKNSMISEECALVILGDAGLNFYFDEYESNKKYNINKQQIWIYCVRGNHEERPENISTMQEIYDNNVKNIVYYEPDFPYIRYFKDGLIYNINEHSTLIIGGAYSVDKIYRLGRANIDESNPEVGKLTGWFPNEQLTAEEMNQISKNIYNKKVDFVFSHTCPISWQPKDLFISGIENVDNAMEKWMAGLSTQFDWKMWLFGHYHDDRQINEKVYMLFNNVVPLEYLWERTKRLTEGD